MGFSRHGDPPYTAPRINQALRPLGWGLLEPVVKRPCSLPPYGACLPLLYSTSAAFRRFSTSPASRCCGLFTRFRAASTSQRITAPAGRTDFHGDLIGRPPTGRLDLHHRRDGLGLFKYVHRLPAATILNAIEGAVGDALGDGLLPSRMRWFMNLASFVLELGVGEGFTFGDNDDAAWCFPLSSGDSRTQCLDLTPRGLKFEALTSDASHRT